MKLTTSILAIAVMVGGTAATQAVAQNADAIDQGAQHCEIAAAKAGNRQQHALDAARHAGSKKPASKPAPGAPAPAVKPAIIPVSAADQRSRRASLR